MTRRTDSLRALFVTNPGFGHLYPMLPIARALQDAGHEVAVASAPDFCQHIERLGFAGLPAGLNWLEGEADKVFPRLREMDLAKMHLWFLTEIFAGEAAERMCSSVVELCRMWEPDFILHNDFEFGSPMAAERTGVPRATLGLGIFLSGRALSSVIGPQIRRLRASQDLSSDAELERLYGDLYFSLYPESYHFPGSIFPRFFQALHLPESDDSHGRRLPEWIHELGERPTVLASLGTVFNKTAEAGEIFRTILEGLGDEPLNLIMTVGPGQEPDKLGTPSANTWIVDYLPHSLLLPFCDVAITQGGSGTTRAALGLGLPVMVIPLSGEDIFHAMRCADLGVGRVVKRPGQFEHYLDKSSYAELGPGAVRAGIRALLECASYRRNARSLAAEMRCLAGPERAVSLLENLVRSSERRGHRPGRTRPWSAGSVAASSGGNGALQEILALIPHRPPFLFIDRVVELRQGVSATARMTFPKSNPIFAGHFPGNPIVPGVLLIECVAQVAALLFAVPRPPGEGDVGFDHKYLAKVERVVFKEPVFPEETIQIEVRIERKLGKLVKVAGRITRGGSAVMEGQIVLYNDRVSGDSR